MYLKLPAATGESKRLVGWKKVSLSAGEQQNITIQVSAGDSSHPLSYWDATAQGWANASGTYTVYLGNSSGNLTSIGTFQMP